MCLLIIYSSLEKYLFRSFVHFIWGYLFFICKSSFYILDIRPLSDTRFTNIFSHSQGCIFTFLVIFSEAKHYKFWSSLLYQLFLSLLMLLVSYLGLHCQIWGCVGLSLCVYYSFIYIPNDKLLAKRKVRWLVYINSSSYFSFIWYLQSRIGFPCHCTPLYLEFELKIFLRTPLKFISCS